VKHRRVLRWAARLVAALAAAALVWATIGFIPAYFSDKSEPDKATYLATIVGSTVTLAAIIGWLRRRDTSDSIASQLRLQTGTDLDRRLRDMRRTAEDIALKYQISGIGNETDLGGVLDALFAGFGRVVLTGQPGVGKSYTALQVAAAAINRDPSIVPLVIPLSRWAGTDNPLERLAQFLQDEFNVPASSAVELIRAGKILPIFDGLDELCADDSDVQTAAELLESLVNWRVNASWAKFFLACRRSTWGQIDPGLTSHHTLTGFSVMAVNRDEAREYLMHSISASEKSVVVNELIGSLQAKGHSHLLRSPWQLNLLAEIVRHRVDQSGGIPAAELEKITDVATVDNLIAYYVESSQGNRKQAIFRIRRALDYWWLSKYAKFLKANAKYAKYLAEEGEQSREVDERDPPARDDERYLPARDLVLHRLWLVAGGTAPRMVDLAMCLILSVPGFYWLTVFFWHRGLLPRVLLLVFGLIWSALLVRTSTKPWVRPATPNWSRLSNPKFSLPQLAAAFLVGTALWFVVNPAVGAIAFVTAWLVIGLTVGFGQTLATDVQPKVIGPFGVLRHERQVSRFSAAAAFPLLALGFSATWGTRLGIVAALAYCLIVGETVACALWRRYLAMIIASALTLPPDPGHCLKRMHDLGHLRIAGMSYQFRHDDVFRYFANRDGFRRAGSRAALLDGPDQ
jgi:NACHT domain